VVSMRPAAVFVVCAVLLTGAVKVQSEVVDERCPGTALERGPSLIGNLDPLKRVVREEGYSGRLLFRITITDTGSVRQTVIIGPVALKESEKVRTSIEALKFCPAVRHSRYVSVQVSFEVQVE